MSRTSFSFTIPRSLVRDQLPGDGVVVSQPIGSKEWPDRLGEGEFFARETLEYAFGQTLRAKTDDRDDERKSHDGFVFRNGYLEVFAGWRAHKKILFLNEFFDGVVRAKLALNLVEARFRPALFDVVVDINGLPVLGSLAEGVFRSLIIRKFADEFEQGYQEAKDIQTEIQRELQARRVPADAPIFGRISEEGFEITVLIGENIKMVRIPPVSFTPGHAFSDPEFDGDPRVEIKAKLDHDDDRVYLNLSMLAAEVGGESSAKGTLRKDIFTADPGFKVKKIEGPLGFHEHTLLDRRVGFCLRDEPTVFGPISVYGDHDGPDAGSFTRLEAKFGEWATVLLAPTEIPPAGETKSFQVAFSRKNYVVPVFRISGDDEFDGHGPWRTVSAHLMFSPKLIFFRVDVRFEETKKGDKCTVAEGKSGFPVYEAPPGWEIISPTENLSWLVCENSEERDHKPDMVRHVLGDFWLYSDRQGIDVSDRKPTPYAHVRVDFSPDYAIDVRLLKT